MTGFDYTKFTERKENTMKGICIGEKLKELRTKFGYKQKDISDFLGVDQSLISKFESGERTISVDMLEKLGDLYCCDLVDISSSVKHDIQVAFRAKNVDVSDLKTIQTVNRIVMNSIFMSELLKGN